MAKEILEYAGALVTIARNGKDAVEALNHSTFDAVLMDIQMPEMDGYVATRLIRSDDRFKTLPIIAMTAHAMTGDREHCLREGMNDHIAKPIDSDDLLIILSQWLRPDQMGVLETVTTPVIPRADAEDELPEIVPGINVPSALKRLQGNQKVLRRLLRAFVRNHREDARYVREALDAGDLGDAQRTTHTLKGAAGNISADNLYVAATKLDKALKMDNLDESRRLLGDVEQSLALLEHSVNTIISPPLQGASEGIHTSPEPESPAVAQIAPNLRELAGLLRAYDVRAVELFRAMQPHLAKLGLDEEVAELERFVEIYDLGGALAVVNTMADRLRISLT